VHWSLERAAVRESRGDVASAAGEVGRAIDWLDAADAQGRSRLHCWRATLLLESRQAAAAVAEAGRAAALVPTAALPRRTRALAHVVAGDAEAALADAQAAVELSGADNPEALNHRAYIRALVGRDLEAALADVETALAGSGDGSPEFLDTRGFILHLLGRHREAIDDLNQAIGKTQQSRRQVAGLAGRADPDDVAYRLRSIDHALAVMHHHRGLACRAIGLERQAAQDFEVAERKGFDPARGVL
jgi:tetratricopeptide (TPR) repeat protein